MKYLLSITFLSFITMLCLSTTAYGQIRVAIETGSTQASHAELAAQINDDTWFDFTATVVNAGQIDSAAELANYDVVILGSSGEYSYGLVGKVVLGGTAELGFVVQANLRQLLGQG